MTLIQTHGIGQHRCDLAAGDQHNWLNLYPSSSAEPGCRQPSTCNQLSTELWIEMLWMLVVCEAIGLMILMTQGEEYLYEVRLLNVHTCTIYPSFNETSHTFHAWYKIRSLRFEMFCHHHRAIKSSKTFIAMQSLICWLLQSRKHHSHVSG